MQENKNKRKLKILYLLDILQRKTDEKNGLTIAEIFNELYLRGIPAERKAIYSDIAALKEAGFSVEKRKTAENVTYHLLGDSLNGKDIRKICCLVQCCDFATKTEKNSLELKLSQKTTEENRARILSGMLNFHAPEQWDIQDELSQVFSSIYENKKVVFTYQGSTVRLSPYSVVSVDRSLYLVGGNKTFPDGIEFFDFSYITDMIPIDRKAETAAEVTKSENFDLRGHIETNLFIPMGKPVTLCLSVREHGLTAVLDDLAKGDAVKDSTVEYFRAIYPSAMSVAKARV